jgi:predicted lactoylglutathione lyase
MHSQIFVNLPVKDLKRSVDFFTKLGYTFNPQFTDDNATCMILGDNLFVMLLTEKFFGSFSNKAICDTSKANEVLTCVACSSREQVDALVAKARAAGGTVPRQPQDHGFMYGHGYEDPDGHTWELVYMTGAPVEHLNK